MQFNYSIVFLFCGCIISNSFSFSSNVASLLIIQPQHDTSVHFDLAIIFANPNIKLEDVVIINTITALSNIYIMDILREQFVKIEIECMKKQRDLILDTMQKNQDTQTELQNYLDRINYNINKLEQGIISD